MGESVKFLHLPDHQIKALVSSRMVILPSKERKDSIEVRCRLHNHRSGFKSCCHYLLGMEL